jgi:gluconolactonase
MFRPLALVAFTLCATAGLQGQTQGGTPFRIEKLNPALDALVDATAQLDTLGDRFALTEGPVWMPDPAGGYLLFSDNAANVIYRWEQGKPLIVFLERSGYTGRDVSTVGAQTVAGRVPILLIGSNGLALDPQRRLIVTAMNDRTVYRLEKDGTRTVLADRYEGRRFNGPNDLVVKSNGTVTLLTSDQDTPGAFGNGITLSPDEKYLYVTAGTRGTMRYEVQADDTIANGRPFVAHGVDGMKTDERGNLYTTSGGTPGIVQITSPEGTPLGRLHLPQPSYEPKPRVCATNVAFGDADGRALFITACTHVFKIRMKVAGSRRPT